MAWSRSNRSPWTLAVAATLALSAGCGSADVSEEDQIRLLADELVDDAGGRLDSDEARCVAREIVTDIGNEQVAEVLERASRRRDREVERVVVAAFDECGAIGSLVGDAG